MNQRAATDQTATAADPPAGPTGALFSGPGIMIICENGSSFDAASFAALDELVDASVWIVASAVAVTSDRWARLCKSIAEGPRASGPWAARPEDQIGSLATDAVHDLSIALCRPKFKQDEHQAKAHAHTFWFLEWSIHFCCGLAEDRPPGFPSDALPTMAAADSVPPPAEPVPPSAAGPKTDEELLDELLAKSNVTFLTDSQQAGFKTLYHHEARLPAKKKGKPSPEDLALRKAFSEAEKKLTKDLTEAAKTEFKKLKKGAKTLRQPNVGNKKGSKKAKVAAEAAPSFRGSKSNEFSAIPNILRCQSLEQVCAAKTKDGLMATGVKYFFDASKFDVMSAADRDVEIAKTLLGRHKGDATDLTKSNMGIEFLADTARPVPSNNTPPVMERINPAKRPWPAQAQFLIAELTMLVKTEEEFGVDARAKRYLTW